MSAENQNRVHAGVPTGGQFAATERGEPGVSLGNDPQQTFHAAADAAADAALDALRAHAREFSPRTKWALVEANGDGGFDTLDYLDTEQKSLTGGGITYDDFDDNLGDPAQHLPSTRATAAWLAAMAKSDDVTGGHARSSGRVLVDVTDGDTTLGAESTTAALLRASAALNAADTTATDAAIGSAMNAAREEFPDAAFMRVTCSDQGDYASLDALFDANGNVITDDDIYDSETGEQIRWLRFSDRSWRTGAIERDDAPGQAAVTGYNDDVLIPIPRG